MAWVKLTNILKSASDSEEYGFSLSVWLLYTGENTRKNANKTSELSSKWDIIAVVHMNSCLDRWDYHEVVHSSNFSISGMWTIIAEYRKIIERQRYPYWICLRIYLN